MSDEKAATAVSVTQPSTTNVTKHETNSSNVTKENNVIKSSDVTKVASNGKHEETKKDALVEKEADKPNKPAPKQSTRKRKPVGFNHAASSPRKTRSSDFYTSMVAEAIRQSEIEAKKEQQKQNRKESKKDNNGGSPNQPITKKAPKAFSRVISVGGETKKAKRPKKESKTKSDKTADSGEIADPNDNSSDFRSFGELKSSLKNLTTLDLAKKLIGVNLCRRVDGQKLIGKIVETEAYLGSVDQCSVTYKKKKSKVLKSYFEDAGSCCVEFLDNGGRQVAVSSALPGEYVLIRALQPMLGREKMKSLRGLKNKTTDKDLAKDPTTTCQALKVGLDHDCLDLLEGGGDLWIEPGAKCSTVIRTRRVLDMHDEKNWNQWSFKKYRFYDSKASCITSRDTKEDKNQVKQSETEVDLDS